MEQTNLISDDESIIELKHEPQQLQQEQPVRTLRNLEPNVWLMKRH